MSLASSPRREFTHCYLAALVFFVACGGETGDQPPDAPPTADASIVDAPVIVDAGTVDGPGGGIDASIQCVPPAPGTAPTYTQLYTRYFAVGTPGHCANSGCHFNGNNGWTCGPNKDTCYAGMVAQGLINPANPRASLIGDRQRSRLRWVSPSGDMPRDNTASNDAARDEIIAWVTACAQNN